MKISKKPNPDRIIAAINNILQRRYDVKIDYIITTKN